MSRPRSLLTDFAVLLTVTCSAYVGVLWNGFVEFDDNIYVMDNSHTADGLSLSSFRYAWTTFDSGNWIPLTWLSYQLDSTVFGMHPIGFHLTNLMLHGANVLLFYAWLIRATGSRWRSLIVSLIFGLHPLHVESVAWIAERKDVLSAFWLLVSLHAYTTYAAKPGVARYFAVCAAFALGLFSKSMVVTLPFLLLLVDFWPLQRCSQWDHSDGTTQAYPMRTAGILVLEKIPLIVLSLLIGIVTIAAASSSKAFASIPLLVRTGNALQSCCWYIAKTFVPTALCVLYPHPMNDLSLGQVALSAIVFGCITLYVVINGLRRPHLLFGWIWFLVSLLPVIGLLHVGSQSHADRYTYIPHIGFLVLIVWESQYWLRRLRAHRMISIALVTTVTVGFAWLTVWQVSVWQTTETLWKQALAVDPDNWYAHGALGHLYLESDQPGLATEHFEQVARRHPEEKESLQKLVEIYRSYPGKQRNSPSFYNDLGRYYVNEQDLPSAAILFAKAVAIASDHVPSRNNLALALSHLGKDREAQSHLETVLLLRPNDVNAHVNLGVLLQKTNQFAAARDHFVAVLKLNPGDVEARNRLADVEKRLGSQSVRGL